MSSEFRWSSGSAYEHYVGRWSRLVASEFIAWLDVAAGATWIDVGCGTGELTRSILRLAAPSKVVSLDPSAGYLDHARASITDPRVEFRYGTDQDVRSVGMSADAVVSGLVLNFVPDPIDALRAAAEATAWGGVIAAYVWDYANGMAMMRHFWDAAAEEDPAAHSKDEGRRFPICAPGALKSAFETAGLAAVAARPIDVTDRFSDFDEYWTPFLSGEASAPGYLASLPPDRQSRVREMIRTRLPIAADGSITLTCRAWAVRGRRLPADDPLESSVMRFLDRELLGTPEEQAADLLEDRRRIKQMEDELLGITAENQRGHMPFNAPQPSGGGFNPNDHYWDGHTWWSLDRRWWWDGHDWKAVGTVDASVGTAGGAIGMGCASMAVAALFFIGFGGCLSSAEIPAVAVVGGIIGTVVAIATAVWVFVRRGHPALYLFSAAGLLVSVSVTAFGVRPSGHLFVIRLDWRCRPAAHRISD